MWSKKIWWSKKIGVQKDFGLNKFCDGCTDTLVGTMDEIDGAGNTRGT